MKGMKPVGPFFLPFSFGSKIIAAHIAGHPTRRGDRIDAVYCHEDIVCRDQLAEIDRKSQGRRYEAGRQAAALIGD